MRARPVRVWRRLSEASVNDVMLGGGEAFMMEQPDGFDFIPAAAGVDTIKYAAAHDCSTTRHEVTKELGIGRLLDLR